MSAPVIPPLGSHPRKPLLGLRRKPGRLALAMFRMPLRAYRHDAGWLLGHTFLEFVHTGRKTGQSYETVAMVLRHDADAHEAVICAGWGPDTDWVRNLRGGPAARLLGTSARSLGWWVWYVRGQGPLAGDSREDLRRASRAVGP